MWIPALRHLGEEGPPDLVTELLWGGGKYLDSMRLAVLLCFARDCEAADKRASEMARLHLGVSSGMLDLSGFSPRSLERLAGLTSLQRLSLRYMVEIESLEGIERLTQLEHLELHRAVRLEDLTRLAGLSRLQDLRCSWAEKPEVSVLLQNEPRTSKPETVRSGMEPEARTTLASVRKLLANGELEGADYREVARRGWRLASSKFSGPCQDYLLHRLLAEAPPESVVASTIKEKLVELDFVVSARSREVHPLDLGTLQVLPLRRLRIECFGPLEAVRGELALGWLGKCPQLREVTLRKYGSWADDLSWVVGLQLRSLQIQRATLDLRPLEGSPLEELHLVGCQLTSLGVLLQLPHLQRLGLHGSLRAPCQEIATLRRRGGVVTGAPW